MPLPLLIFGCSWLLAHSLLLITHLFIAITPSCHLLALLELVVLQWKMPKHSLVSGPTQTLLFVSIISWTCRKLTLRPALTRSCLCLLECCKSHKQANFSLNMPADKGPVDPPHHHHHPELAPPLPALPVYGCLQIVTPLCELFKLGGFLLPCLQHQQQALKHAYPHLSDAVFSFRIITLLVVLSWIMEAAANEASCPRWL